MRVNKLDAARLESEGLPPEKAMQKIIDWVEQERSGKKDRPVFVAHNAPFDWMFFCYYCGHTNVKNSFGYSALDTKALAMGVLEIPWNQTSLKNVAGLVGLAPVDPEELHHAGRDAAYTARVFCGLMNRANVARPPPRGLLIAGGLLIAATAVRLRRERPRSRGHGRSVRGGARRRGHKRRSGVPRVSREEPSPGRYAARVEEDRAPLRSAGSVHGLDTDRPRDTEDGDHDARAAGDGVSVDRRGGVHVHPGVLRWGFLPLLFGL